MNQTVIEELIKGCRQNERKAQRQLYEQYFNLFYSIVKRYEKDHEHIQTIVNNAFMSIFKSIEQYSGVGNFEGWMKKILINKALDHLKQNKGLYVVDKEVEKIGETVMVENEVLSHYNMAELFEMIQELPAVTRAVFNLYAIDGFTHKEIAQQLNMSEGTSRWHLSEARKQLQKKVNNPQPLKTQRTLWKI